MTLEGKKTYITATALAMASFALAMDWLSKEQDQVIVGLYALETGTRLSVADAQGRPTPDDQVVLGTVRVDR